MDRFERMTRDVLDVLEPSLQFYRQYPGDSARYMALPDVVQGLAWTATTLVVPLVITAGNEVIKERVKEWFARSKTSREPLVFPQIEIEATRTMLNQVPSVEPTAADIAEAERVVASFLSFHGWPNQMAQADAREVLARIVSRLSSRS
jgi:hypothetical protein